MNHGDTEAREEGEIGAGVFGVITCRDLQRT